MPELKADKISTMVFKIEERYLSLFCSHPAGQLKKRTEKKVSRFPKDLLMLPELNLKGKFRVLCLCFFLSFWIK